MADTFEKLITTFVGPTTTIYGALFVWAGGKYYQVSLLTPEQEEALGLNRTVVLKFYGKVEPNLDLSGNDLKVYVDGIEWTGSGIVKNSNCIDVIFKEIFIRSQRLITFETLQGNPIDRYAVKARVYDAYDVVLAKIGIAESIPVLGTYRFANILLPEEKNLLEDDVAPKEEENLNLSPGDLSGLTNELIGPLDPNVGEWLIPTDTFAPSFDFSNLGNFTFNPIIIEPLTSPTPVEVIGGGTSPTTEINTGIGVGINYEESTVDIGINSNNQIVDATIGEVTGGNIE